MADAKPTKVTVEAINYHTNAGEEYQVGDTYEVDEAAVDNLAIQRMAIRVDRTAVAKKAAKPTKAAAKKARKSRR
jgi:uncharacterized Zn finger protein